LQMETEVFLFNYASRSKQVAYIDFHN
jgi:hypothetical protein